MTISKKTSAAPYLAVRIAVLTDMNNETFMASADCVGEHGLCVDQRD